MNRSTQQLRRHRIAGVVTAALLSVGVLSACGGGGSDAGSPGKAATGTSAESGAKSRSQKPEVETKMEAGLQPGDALSAHNFALDIDGARAEYLQSVSGLDLEQETVQYESTQDGTPTQRLIPGQQSGGTMTVVRGAEQSAQFTDLINGATQPATATVALLDYQDTVVKQYTMENPQVIKVDNAAVGEVATQSVTIRFTSLTVS